MLKHAAWTTSRFVAHRFGPASRLLYGMASVYVRSYKNMNYDMATNGELLLLDRLSTQTIKTVFDVGANSGDYTEACLSRFPDATIHAFEIVPATFKKLQSNLGTPSRVELNNFGLSDHAGTVEINYSPNHDRTSSIIEDASIHPWEREKLEVQVGTGDEYCHNNGVLSIDILKIDVEGAEHLVLNGFHESLEQSIVAAIQFEFGMANIYSKFLLKDFWSLLTGYGFVLGPIMPNGVDFKDYNPRDEDFQGAPNFFAVHRKRATMIEAVRRR